MIIYLKEKGAEMRWSTVPFGKYKGKTFPEIIVRDADWFFWALPKLYGTLADEAQELAREHGPSKFRNEVGGAWKSNINLTWIIGLMALSLSTPTTLLPDGVLDCHTSICGGRFAANMTSERAVSCFGISGGTILVSTND